MDHVQIINLVPKFLKFYELTNHPGLSHERRWELWKEHYHFAAVPPGEEGQEMAKDLLKERKPPLPLFF